MRFSFIAAIFQTFIFISITVFSQIPNQNQVTIRNDRVIMLNGQPFFPIGVCMENENLYSQLTDNGFNFINLFSENHFMFSDSCGFNAKNIISGDVTTNIPYSEMLGKYAGNIRWNTNAQRIFNYMQNDRFYVFADDYTFYPDDIDQFIINSGSCGDSVILNTKFNQNVRDSAVDRLINISGWPGNKLIGVYVKDDANMFEVGYPDRLYYYNTYLNTRINNYKQTYDYFKKNYPNSLVMMSLPTCYFPRAMYPEDWPNVDSAREAWIRDALRFVQSCDVIFCPGAMSSEYADTAYMIYSNEYPSLFPEHLNTLFTRVLPSNKAVFGGLLFDVFQTLPHPTDPQFLNKIKWEIYVGLEKGCTGLIFWGWHKLARPDGQISWMAWGCVKTIIYEMTKKLQLNDKVFIQTNSGQIAHTVSGNYSGNISFAVYKIDGWNDYYLLLTNNPNGSLFANEPDNTITLKSDTNIVSWKNKSITEIFSNQRMQISQYSSIQFTSPSYGVSLFHIQNIPVPAKYTLYQNYPNPFNPSTFIKYDIAVNTPVKLNIYDATGKLIKSLINEIQQAGSYQIEFDGSKLPSGIYFYELLSGSFKQSRKMVILK